MSISKKRKQALSEFDSDNFLFDIDYMILVNSDIIYSDNFFLISHMNIQMIAERMKAIYSV